MGDKVTDYSRKNRKAAVAARRRADAEAEAAWEFESELRAAEAYRDDFPAGEYEVDPRDG